MSQSTSMHISHRLKPTILLSLLAGNVMVALLAAAVWSEQPPEVLRRRPNEASPGFQYYVATTGDDSNPGTNLRPWRTIGNAAKRVRPGDTVRVRPGIYRENVLMRTSGNAEEPILFIATVKWGAQVVGVRRSFPSGAFYATICILGSYIDFVGFDISAPHSLIGIQVGDGGISGNGSHDRILGNRVHDVAGGCKLGFCDHKHYPRLDTAGAGILVGGDKHKNHNNDVIGNLVFDIGDPLNSFNVSLVHGIYVDNGGQVEYTSPALYAAKVQNNIIYRIEASGIQEYHCTTNNIVTYNTITDAGVAGIWVAGQPVGGKPKEGCINSGGIVADNILMHNGWNTICRAGGGRCVNERDAGGGCGIQVSATSAAVQFVNNLSFANRCGYRAKDNFSLAGRGHTLAGNLMGANPRFVNYLAGGGGDYHLRRDSPAIGLGFSADAPTTDFDGVRRPQGHGYDVGAYEFVK